MKQLKAAICAIATTLLLLCLSGFCFAAEDIVEHYLDANYDEGIYFSVSHPDSLQTLFAGGRGIGPLNIHQWKHLTINAVFRYKDEDGQIHTEKIGSNARWDSTDNSVITVNEGGPKSSCEITTIQTGSASVVLSYPYNGKTYTGTVSFNVKKLSINGSAETLRYAALSMLSYADLGSYKGKTVDYILRPFDSGGKIQANIGIGKPILVSDTYKVFADERDFIVACAGNCVITDIYKVGSFYGVLFRNGNQYIMAFRGSHDFGDYLSDIKLGLGKIESDQFRSALNFYYNYSGYSPVLTGHSLGGGLANYVSVLTGSRAYTFNAPSTMVTAVSNYIAGTEFGFMGEYYWGLDDKLRTDYVNNSDWVGKVGVGDAINHVKTGSSSNLKSGNLDNTVYQTPMVMNNCESFHTQKKLNDHGILRMISYNKNSETISMSATVGIPTSPTYHHFYWAENNSEYFFGSTGSDSIRSSSGSGNKGAYVFAGEGDDVINLLTGYAAETIVAGGGDDTIYASAGNSSFHYYSGHGDDIIYDSHGDDILYLHGVSDVTVTPDAPSTDGNYYVKANGSDTPLLVLHIGKGTGSFSVYQGSSQLIKKINRVGTGSMNACIACPVKVSIYDKSERLIETIEDGVVYNGGGEYGYFSTYEEDGSFGKNITLLSDDYHMVIEGTAEGTMKYYCQYNDTDTTSIKSVSSVPVHAGAKYYPASITDTYLLFADLNGDDIIDYQPSSQEISSVSIDEALTVYLGTTAQLTPKFTPNNKLADIVWENSNPEVVYISDDGVLTALGVGEATITVTALNGENASARCVVTVPDENLSVEDTTVTGIEKIIAYTGEAYYPEISVSFRGMTLTEGKAYYVEYSDEVMPGTAAITIHGIWPFYGTRIIEYVIYQYVPKTVSEAVNAIIQEMNDAGITGEYNKALWLHNWLINNANYDYTYSYYYADGVLLKKTGVCQSYALAYQLLLNKAGIENQMISSSEMDHAWNLAKLDGEWCHIDCTWDDPNEGGMEHQFYFGMNDDLIARDHIWDRNKYTSSSSLQNYYPIRNGERVFSNSGELNTILVPLFISQEKSFTILYTGTDPGVTALSAFEEWYSNNNWKYGIRSFVPTFNKIYCSINEIVYTDPWEKPVNKLSNPVAAPSFSMNSPVGNFSLNNYQGNGVVLIFGREGCLNTRGLLDRLQAELDALHNSGIEVLISIEYAETESDIQPVKNDYPDFLYCYDQRSLMSDYLEAVDYFYTYDTGWVTYPCVFIINGDGKITYYSTGYVSDLDELVSEAFAASSLNPLPVPNEYQYYNADTGNANLSEIRDGNVKRALQAACSDSRGVLFLNDGGVYSSDYTFMKKWEENYSLFSSLGLSFVACFNEITDEERQAFPHIIFAEYDENDPFFWDLLDAVNWDFTKPAYYQCCYFLEKNGHIADYCNGGTLSIWNIIHILETVESVVADIDSDGISATPLDAMFLARWLAGWEGYDINEAASDLDEDGEITVRDAIILARHIAGWVGYKAFPYRP